VRFIEDLRDIHTGEDIWVLGAGPSMDEYPTDFFEDKICIGVNWVFSAFMDMGEGVEKFSSRAFYSVHEHRSVPDWIAKHNPKFLKQCFFLLPPSRRPGMAWWRDYNPDPYYMRWGLRGKAAVSATDQDFMDTAKCLVSDRIDCEYVCRGTTLHWAIQAAVVLGATKIYIAGALGLKGYMLSHGSYYRQIAPHKYEHPHWREGTKSLARAFKPYGVKIVEYRYDSGEQQL